MATIKDIATKLGVSVSTVSKGLNGASDISEELRQLVLDTAVEMGYSTKRSRKEENRKEWGSKTSYRPEMQSRNGLIYKDYVSGMSVCQLAKNYYLSEKSIQRVIRQEKITKVS